MSKGMCLFVQPVVNIENNKIICAEVLIRQYRGISGVQNILNYVKKNNMYRQFDMDVLDEMLRLINEAEDTEYPVSVNVLSKTIEEKGIAEEIINRIDKRKVKRNKIVIEINEETDLSNGVVIENIKKLSKAGIRIALDDFGAGRTTMLSFVLCNFDILKIDRDFITEHKWDRKRYLLKMVMQIAEELELTVIAEGLETVYDIDRVADIGVNYIQGFYFGVPELLSEFLKKQERKRFRVRDYEIEEVKRDMTYVQA